MPHPPFFKSIKSATFKESQGILSVHRITFIMTQVTVQGAEAFKVNANVKKGGFMPTPQLNWIHLARQSAVSVLYISGSMLTAYHITAFKTDKWGLYFHDDNQFWIAIGVGLLIAGWAIRNWKNI